MLKEWGNAYWDLFHTLTYKLNSNYKVKELLGIYIDLCNILPCPICKEHAKSYLKSIKTSNITTREQLSKMFFDFHNNVNRKLRKKIFTQEKFDIMYSNKNLVTVLNTFINIFMKYKRNGGLSINTLFKDQFINNFINFVKSNRTHFISN